MNNLRRLILPAVLVGILLGATSEVQAHVLKESNGISAVLHMPPDDNPVAGEPTKLYFSFGDTANTFNLEHCDCQLVAKNNGRTVQIGTIKPSLPGATLNGVVAVTFPAVGVYDVAINGNAADNQFKMFQLNYLVRVETASTTVASAQEPIQQDSHFDLLLIAGGSLVILAVAARYNIRRGGRYRKQTKTKATRAGKP